MINYTNPVSKVVDTKSVTLLSLNTFPPVEQQKKRENSITDLLTQYVLFYTSKVRWNKVFRIIIFVISFFILIVFAGFLLYWTQKILSENILEIGHLVSLITISGTFIGTFITVLKIITQYVFPQDDEKHIVDFVTQVQKSDLDNAKLMNESSNGALNTEIAELQKKIKDLESMIKASTDNLNIQIQIISALHKEIENKDIQIKALKKHNEDANKTIADKNNKK